MMNLTYGMAFATVTALVVILGDYLIKLAADAAAPVTSGQVIAGCLLYAVSAVLWFFAIQHVSLASAGVAYSMLTLIGLCAMGALWFDEPIRVREAAGIACALVAMLLMARVG